MQPIQTMFFPIKLKARKFLEEVLLKDTNTWKELQKLCQLDWWSNQVFLVVRPNFQYWDKAYIKNLKIYPKKPPTVYFWNIHLLKQEKQNCSIMEALDMNSNTVTA